MPRRLKIRRSEHSEGIKMPKMAKTNSPIASPNRLPKRYFTPDLVLFVFGFEWISPRNGGFWVFFWKTGCWKVGRYYISNTNTPDFSRLNDVK